MSSTSSDRVVTLSPKEGVLTATSSNSTEDVSALWASTRPSAAPFVTRTLYTPSSIIAAVSLPDAASPSFPSSDDDLKEVSRKAAALGTLALKAAGSKEFQIDTVYSPHAAAVGATLAGWTWNLKSTTDAKAKLEASIISPLPSTLPPLASDVHPTPLNWESGIIYGKAQNLARELMELPANRLTPTTFCDRAVEQFKGFKGVEVKVHKKDWAEEKKMGSFLSVARGSDEECRFLEITYYGAKDKNEKPIAFIGKGITFDSGGISLKPGAAMKEMRADMGGAATTLASTWAIASLELPVNLILCIPLTENMPSGHATKPGDIVIASNGVTIEVDNTDAEGRLVLADALYYATSTYKPSAVIDVATLTGAMMIALGNQFTGVFTNSDKLWSELEIAGLSERDRVWRMPLDEGYISQIDGTGMDLCNTGGRLAGSCTAAIFLKRFVDGLVVDGKDIANSFSATAEQKAALTPWAHLDIAGVMDLAKADGYNRSGMTGRPVRTLIEYVRRTVKA